MTGVRGNDGVTTSTDPVERTSSRVQAVVAFFPPTDFLHYGGQAGPALNLGLTNWFRSIGLGVVPPQTSEKELGRALSPRYDVTRSAAPTLLIHGDLDPIVPLQQSEVFLEAMRAAGAPCQLRIKRGAGHGWADMGSDLHAAMEWFGRYLNGPPARG
jgi:dipeptidyl aminopeptidase/acylaminoacyl peptidase